MFYGSRLAAADYVDIAPSAILACFDIISRVRCRHDLWTDDKLETKQRIRCVAEQIVDDWIQSLPLREGGEHVHDVGEPELQCVVNSQPSIHRSCRIFDLDGQLEVPDHVSNLPLAPLSSRENLDPHSATQDPRQTQGRLV